LVTTATTTAAAAAVAAVAAAVAAVVVISALPAVVALFRLCSPHNPPPLTWGMMIWVIDCHWWLSMTQMCTFQTLWREWTRCYPTGETTAITITTTMTATTAALSTTSTISAISVIQHSISGML
jgi:hypothetical protein